MLEMPHLKPQRVKESVLLLFEPTYKYRRDGVCLSSRRRIVVFSRLLSGTFVCGTLPGWCCAVAVLFMLVAANAHSADTAFGRTRDRLFGRYNFGGNAT